MRTISSEMQRLLQDNSTMMLKATLTYADGTTSELGSSDFISGTGSFEQATSSDSSFDVGGAVVGKFSVTLNNFDGHLDDADFTDATIVPYVGKSVTNGTEWVRMGSYTVDQPDTYDGTIAIDCLDNLSKLSSVRYSEVSTTFPCRPSKALQDIFDRCDVTLDWGSDRLNDSENIQRSPTDTGISCLQAASYLAQLMGLWLRATDDGHVLAAWYDTCAFDSGVTWADATQSFGSEEAAQSIWADTRSLVTTGSKLRRGTATVTHAYTSTVRTDDVVITGVRVTEQNEIKEDESGNLTNGADGSTELAGSAGYVIAIGQNPFVEYGRAGGVAKELYGRVGGMRFRPFQLTAPADPSIEAGDSIVYLDRKQRSHISYVTSVTLAVDRAMTVRCSAKSAARNSAVSASSATQAIVKARNEYRRDMTARDLALSDLAERVAHSSGVYHSEQVMDDGSTIHYLHDKPDISDSGIIWKMAADALSVSTDGGKTYATGLTARGDAILNRIYAIGIDAQHITTGRLSSHDGENYFDLDTGEASFSAGTKIGGHSVATQVDVLYAINDSPTEAPKDDQWSTTAPKWQEGRYIWSKTRTYHGTEFVDSEPECITGARGASGESVTTLGIQYARGVSGTVVPDSGWQDQIPEVPQGSYLWCRVSYSDGSDTYTCSRMGADGKDGTSVAIQSATKADGVTTLVVSDGTRTRTLTIEDGQDGTNGQDGKPGADGVSSYVHIAWALSADGTNGFSSSDSTRKTYIGVYADHDEKDSENPSSYSWSLIKGADGSSGQSAWSLVLAVDPSLSFSNEPISATLTATARYGETEAPYGELYSSGLRYMWLMDGVATMSSVGPTLKVKSKVGSSVTVECRLITQKEDASTYYGVASVDLPGLESLDGNGAVGNAAEFNKKYGFGDETFLAGTFEALPYDNSSSSSTFRFDATLTDGTVANTDTVTIGPGSGQQVRLALNLPQDVAVDTIAIECPDGSKCKVRAVSRVRIETYGFECLASAVAPFVSSKDGERGTGASEIVEQYYLSTSNTSQSGGSWSTEQPAWTSGCYVWTRSQVTWTDGTVTYTTPQLAKAINGANQTASEAKSTAISASSTADDAKSTADATKTELDNLNTQEGVFNKLTNNGETQGIFMQGGKVYLNGEYIKADTISGDSLKAGTIMRVGDNRNYAIVNGSNFEFYSGSNKKFDIDANGHPSKSFTFTSFSYNGSWNISNMGVYAFENESDVPISLEFVDESTFVKDNGNYSNARYVVTPPYGAPMCVTDDDGTNVAQVDLSLYGINRDLTHVTEVKLDHVSTHGQFVRYYGEIDGSRNNSCGPWYLGIYYAPLDTKAFSWGIWSARGYINRQGITANGFMYGTIKYKQMDEEPVVTCNGNELLTEGNLTAAMLSTNGLFTGNIHVNDGSTAGVTLSFENGVLRYRF